MTIATRAKRATILSTKMKDILAQLEQDDTPIRIENSTETYYLLRADQLMRLLQISSSKTENSTEFTAADFGLSEADLIAYRKLSERQQKRVRASKQQPLDAELERHLEEIKQHPKLYSKQEVEQAVQALEAAMLHNVLAAVPVTPSL